MLRVRLAVLVLVRLYCLRVPAWPRRPREGNEPGWLGVVVARGELKQWIDSTPIVERPNRPFHFYGNAVRRQYYRGNPLPRPDDVVKGGSSLIFKRQANQ